MSYFFLFLLANNGDRIAVKPSFARVIARYVFQVYICELFEQTALRDWTDSSKYLHTSNVTRALYYLLRQFEDVKFMGHFMKKELVSWGDFLSRWKFLTILNLASSS